jgi:hypothetical protein
MCPKRENTVVSPKSLHRITPMRQTIQPARTPSPASNSNHIRTLHSPQHPTPSPPLPHISATGPHIVNLPPTEPGLGLIHAAAARHAAPAEIRRRARVRPRSTGVVVGAAVEVGDGSRSVVPVFSVDGVAVFARGRDEAHCWCCG